ncbi:MAG TPA: DNA repair protein RadA [Candidatus Saccharimonadales bacterium]|nr:DNA repair protein RadA [Candidatus Saccharimonadales bacterium]
MAKQLTKFVCSNCGAQYSSWAGRCSQCGEWNTITEEVQLVSAASGSGLNKKAGLGSKLQPQAVAASASKADARMPTGMKDVDLVLGGGIVAGSVNLIAGQPGIGKSTLLLQLASLVAQDHRVLYVSGEESEHQVGMRAQRLGVAGAKNLQLATTNIAEDIAATVADDQFDFVVVDSIQTMTVQAVAAAPGSVSQITNSTAVLVAAAKTSNTAMFVVGHVTKEGSIAGPKVLEHIVDVVLQLEGDAYGGFKVLRATKNRFGPTSEAAIMEMDEQGLRSVENPSQALLAERQITDGSVVLATLEGTRPLLVEVQALVNKTAYGYPKRAASGMDLNRLNLLVAMLERRTKLSLSEQDIYINIVGGIRLNDPAADLAICMAIGSAAKGLQLKQNAVVFGEVGLSGEVRHVPFIEKRVGEAKKLGFDCAIGPRLRSTRAKAEPFLHAVPDIRSALNEFLEK